MALTLNHFCCVIQLGAVNRFKEMAKVNWSERGLDKIMVDKLTLEELEGQVSRPQQSLGEVSESLADIIRDSAVGYYALSSAAFIG